METEIIKGFFDIDYTKKETLKDERAIIHYISTPDLDRGRDIMNPKGCDYSEFQTSPTVFFNHNYNKPIGKAMWVKRENGGVLAKTFFSESAEANDYYLLHLEGVINTWSIGFDAVYDKDGKVKAGTIEYDDKKRVRTFNEWKLLEYSSAPLAMNPNCLDQAKSICKSVEMLNEIKSFDFILDIKKEFTGEIENIKTLVTSKDIEIEKLKSQITKLSKRKVESAGLDYNKIFARVLSDLTGKKIKPE